MKCGDYKKPKFCKGVLEAGKCEKVQHAKMCLETCDMCKSKCRDKKSSKECKKLMEAGKCENKYIAKKKCKKTCDMC